jgi:hypothetical protein
MEELDLDEVDLEDFDLINEFNDEQDLINDCDDMFDDIDSGDLVCLNVHHQPLPAARYQTQFRSPRQVAASEQPAVAHPLNVALDELQQVVDDPEIINTQTRVNINLLK